MTYVAALYKALRSETPVEKDTQRLYTSQLKVSLRQEGNPSFQSIQDVKKNRYSLTLSLDGVCLTGNGQFFPSLPLNPRHFKTNHDATR